MNWEKRKVNRKEGENRFVKLDVTLNKRIATYFTESEHKEITDFCKKKGISMNEFARTAISEYLKSYSSGI